MNSPAADHNLGVDHPRKVELPAMPTKRRHYSVFGLLPIAVGQEDRRTRVILPLFNFTSIVRP